MASPAVVPTGKAGELFIPALNRTIRQVEWREDDFYDTVEVTAAAQAGSEYNFFRENLPTKKEQHANIATQGRLPSGQELVMFRMGIHVRAYRGNAAAKSADQLKIIENGVFEFKLGERLVSRGPLLKYGSGYGVSGALANDSQAAGAVEIAALSIGVPSQAAAPVLLVPQEINDQDELYGRLFFPAAAWLGAYTGATPAAVTLVSAFLHGFIKKPLGK
jgi:hypothetical protein